jgi:glycosyltransferase involved in cell wall biosynthesis
MRIGVSALLVHPKRFGGAETYARQLLTWLPQVDTQNEYFVFVAAGSDLHVSAPNFSVIECPAPVENVYTRVLWEHLRLPRILRQYPLDLVHFPGSTAPYGYRGTSVVTIHDTLRFQLPELTPLLLGRYYDFIQKRIARSGKHVIAVSHTDAGVMIERLGLEPDRVSVVPLGVHDAFLRTAGAERASAGKSYLLWVGHPYRHKNLEVLLDAVALLAERISDAPPLRLVGVKQIDHRRLLREIESRQIADFVSVEPPVDHAHMPDVYRGAFAFCFPSKCESFGLPVLEAMASGTAVACSDLPSFRELFSDHVVYFPATSAGALADAVHGLLADGELRHHIEIRGQAHARQFTWRTCAEKTVAVYRRLLS